MLRKMYVIPSFEIHSGPAGLFDLGPPACTLKSNMLALWRKHFVVSENMLEMECTNLTPSNVLETSGHVERFTDFMTKDEVTGECFRADVLLEQGIDEFLATNPQLTSAEKDEHLIIQRQADAFSAEELWKMLQKYNVRSPTNKDNGLTMPYPFNLMFKTTIGPDGKSVGFLRPETAQGLFVNFKRLYEYNQTKMPFSAAQVGLGFRNEIAPRGGLLRVREFCMAEIEHFVHPDQKKHSKFSDIAAKEIVLFSADAQLSTGRTSSISVGEAVSKGIIDNETLGYFMARTQLWLEKIGCDPTRMRFRQHLKTEMAHYSKDCWDMEIEMSSGWTECVGHADRACYDLECHGKKTNTSMTASQLLKEPVKVENLIAEPQKKKLGPKFGKDAKAILTAFEAMDEDAIKTIKAAMEADGKAMVGDFELAADMVTFKVEKKNVVEMKYTPSVIEPSFGIGRVLNAVLEHSFTQRNGDENRCVMNFKPCVAPIKLGIFRLVSSPLLDIIVSRVYENAADAGIVCRVDSSSGTVGRRYARADELGIPFGITVDFTSLQDDTVTLRDRNTMAQVRIPIKELNEVITNLCAERYDWDGVTSRYAVIKDGGDDEEEESQAKVEVAKPLVVETTLRGMFSRPNPAYGK
jgi:glycyl-tRNA synthetase